MPCSRFRGPYWKAGRILGSRRPREGEGAELAGKGRHVVSGPLLVDLPVVADPVDVDGVPSDAASGRRAPEQIAFVSRSDDEPHYDQIGAGDHILLLGAKIWEGSEEGGEQPG